jgi:hypothetical protein
MKWQYYGGPADGGEIPAFLTRQDFILLEGSKSNNNGVVYYYVKVKEDRIFEYAGEVEEEVNE